MNFQQLRIIRETARRNFNLTEVAHALYTSQSGVSKHIRDLEEELGLQLFVRRGKRLLGLTEPGRELLPIVERMLHDSATIKQLADHFTRKDEGRLTIATTHTQARYRIAELVSRFVGLFPKVRLEIFESNPQTIADQLARGEADIGIATESLSEHPELVTFPFYRWRHAVVVPRGHALAALSAPSLADVAAWPLITYHEAFAGRRRVNETFHNAGIVPNVILSAVDSDVIKRYVELGLGVGIVSPIAFDPERDTQLQLLRADALFPENTTVIAVRRGHYLRSFGYRFIELCSPELSADEARREILRNGE
jgi:LysR family cys regulon transcriptional activator